jgi:hypothetical protein
LSVSSAPFLSLARLLMRTVKGRLTNRSGTCREKVHPENSKSHPVVYAACTNIKEGVKTESIGLERSCEESSGTKQQLKQSLRHHTPRLTDKIMPQAMTDSSSRPHISEKPPSQPLASLASTTPSSQPLPSPPVPTTQSRPFQRRYGNSWIGPNVARDTSQSQSQAQPLPDSKSRKHLFRVEDSAWPDGVRNTRPFKYMPLLNHPSNSGCDRGQIWPSMYGSTMANSLGLCWATFSDNQHCIHGAQCDWRHRDLSGDEGRWLFRLGKGQYVAQFEIGKEISLGNVVVEDTQWPH